MKKKYVKPEIMFEDFSLSTNVAGDCGVKTYTPNAGKCAYIVDTGSFGTYNIFTNEIPLVCTTTDGKLDKSEDGIYNGICYHTPYEDSNLFNS